MLEKHRHLLLKFRQEIVDDLLVDDVLSFLQSKFILDSEDAEVIRGERTSRRQAEKLLDIIPERGYEAFEHFLSTLKENYPHLARLLLGSSKEEQIVIIRETVDSPLQCKYAILHVFGLSTSNIHRNILSSS